MLRNPTQARRYTQPIELLYAAPSVDEYGHVSLGAPEPVLRAFAHVEQMSATKTMMTFQLLKKQTAKEISLKITNYNLKGTYYDYKK